MFVMPRCIRRVVLAVAAVPMLQIGGCTLGTFLGDTVSTAFDQAVVGGLVGGLGTVVSPFLAALF